MQNQQNALSGKELGRLAVEGVANPKVVLMAVGLIALGVDLFVEPISPVGLALILLATAPWLLQTWSQRLQPVTANIATIRTQAEGAMHQLPGARPAEQRNGTSRQEALASKPERSSVSARDPLRKMTPAHAAPGQAPLKPAGSEVERLAATPKDPLIRTNPPRTA